MTLDRGLLQDVIQPHLLDVKPYRCARDDFSEGILLDANENAFGNAVLEGDAASKQLELHRYPDPHHTTLRTHLAASHSLPGMDYVFTGNGSDEAIDLLIRLCCRSGVQWDPRSQALVSDEIVICRPTYGMYRVSADIQGVRVQDVPLKADFQVDVEALEGYLRASQSALKKEHASQESDGNVFVDPQHITPRVKCIFLCSPGNPTGTALWTQDILRVVEMARNYPCLVVVDEAYQEFVQDPLKASVVPCVKQYENLVVLRTLSKAYGLAGVRLGMALSQPNLISYLQRIKPPYNLSTPVQQLVCSVLSQELQSQSKQTTSEMNRNMNTPHSNTQQTIDTLLKARTHLLNELLSLPTEYPHIHLRLRGGLDANFLLIQFLKPNEPEVGCNQTALYFYQNLAVPNTKPILEKQQESTEEEEQEDSKNACTPIIVRYRGSEPGCQGCLRITVGTPQENQLLLSRIKQLAHAWTGVFEP